MGSITVIAIVNNQRGNSSLLFAILTGVLLLTSLSLAYLLHRSHSLTRTQLRLDRCVENKGTRWTTLFNRVDQLNLALAALKAAKMGSVLAPAAIPAITAQIQVVYLGQEAIHTMWTAERAAWLVGGLCGGLDITLPLPDFPWQRLPPDPLGPGLLRASSTIKEIRFQTLHWGRHGRRSSAALLRRGPIRETHTSVNTDNSWQADFVPVQL